MAVLGRINIELEESGYLLPRFSPINRRGFELTCGVIDRFLFMA
jgi:hypothetical protein